MNEQVDVVAILKRIQEQLSALERKIDALAMAKPQERSFNRDRPFSKPFQTYGSAPRKSYGDHGPRKEYGPKKDFGPKKEFGQGGGFEKRAGGGDNRGFNPKFSSKKKPFFKAGPSK